MGPDYGNIAIKCAHSFAELRGGGYFKKGEYGLPDQTIAYTMLACSKCGETKEVMQRDYRAAAK